MRKTVLWGFMQADNLKLESLRLKSFLLSWIRIHLVEKRSWKELGQFRVANFVMNLERIELDSATEVWMQEWDSFQ